MHIDWFDFWLIFSWVLLLLLGIWLVIRFFSRIAFRKDLKYIKQQQVKNIITRQQIHPIKDVYDVEIFELKKEIDNLMKDVCFDIYDRRKMDKIQQSEVDFRFDFEESLEKLLDGKIMDIIKEKDILLQQKDGLIAWLEEKNHKIIEEIVHKMFYLLLEKDKLLRQKDDMIHYFKEKTKELNFLETFDEKHLISSEYSQKKLTPVSVHDKADFINVNI